MEIKRYDLEVVGLVNWQDKDGEFVLFQDVEKAVKLWEMVGIQNGKECDGCACCQIDSEIGCFCGIFNDVELEHKKSSYTRCQQCLDLFGEE